MEASTNGEIVIYDGDNPDLLESNSPGRSTPTLGQQNVDTSEVEVGHEVGKEMESSTTGDVSSNVEEPKVGMVFNTMEDVEVFYKRYARSVGFGVTRVQGSYTENDDGVKERTATTWKCDCYGDLERREKSKSKKMAKEGLTENDEEEEICNLKRRESKKCFCTALLYAKRNVSRQWVVSKIVLEHANHTPTSSQSKLVKDFRMEDFNSSMQRRLENERDAVVTVPQIFTSMSLERGGFDNMPVTEKDMRHIVDKRRRLKMAGGGCNALISYFDKMQKENPNFYHTHRLDSTGTMKDILWVDPRSRAAYEEFSDVVCFDTTYLTNQYHLPFANFVGVNHHGQSILFGCALITNEDSDTFEWVFSK